MVTIIGIIFLWFLPINLIQLSVEGSEQKIHEIICWTAHTEP